MDTSRADATTPGAVLRRAALLLWAAPCSLLAIVPGLLLVCMGGSLRRVQGTLEIALREQQQTVPRWVGRVSVGGMTLGHVILGQSHELLARLRQHEQVHVRQYELLGPLFLLAYPLASVWALVRGGNAYRDNFFEQQAFRHCGE